MYVITHKDCVGQMSGYNPNILFMMCKKQKEQGQKWNPEVFCEDNMYNSYCRGFNWEDTEEGFRFWHDVILKKHEYLFDQYFVNIWPKYRKIRQLDLDKENIDYPLEVIEALCINYYVQYGIYPNDDFRELTRICSYPVRESMDWRETRHGYEFWFDVIKNRNFERFYREYDLKAEQIVLSGEKQIYTPFF